MRRLDLFSILLFAATPLAADSPVSVARTHENTLNDFIREIPLVAGSWEDQVRRLSSVQEQLYLHELKMRGEGLPLEMAVMFSSNYTSILTALVQDRITEEYGRELLSIHRQLLERTRVWLGQSRRDESFPEDLARNVEHFRSELDRCAIPLSDVPDEVRTPVINGYQAWIGELLAWGESSGRLSSGDRSRIKTKLDELERFEGYYKADGNLQPFERDQLHGRFLKITQELIVVVSR
jgi:hypothetical protein